jgi:hypothetical protein
MSKGTTRRAVRVNDALWQAALSVAAERGEKLSDILRAALVDYIAMWGTKQQQATTSKEQP